MNIELHPSMASPASLADVLVQRQEDILQRWAPRLRELREHLPELLQQLATMLRQGRCEQEASLPPRHLPSGFDLETLVREYGTLRESILDLVEELGVKVTLREVRTLTACLSARVTLAVSEYIRQRDESARLNEARLQALLDHATEVTERKQALALRETTQRLQAILETAVDGIITIDEQGHILSLNPATVRIFGYSPQELMGRDISMLMPQPYRHEHASYMRNYLETGVRKVIGIGREVQGQRKDGSIFPLELSVSETLLPSGRFFTGIVRDISVRKRASQAQALLLEVGTLLSHSLDVPTTLESLATLAVTHLCDYCTVDMLGEDRQLQRLKVAARHPEKRELVRKAMAYPPVLGSRSPLAQVLESGQPLLVPEFTPAMLEATARGPEHRALMEQLAPRSVIFIPLVARGRTLGIISLAWTRPRPTSLAADVELARGIADRAAVAIDNARLYEEAQQAIRMREDVVAIVSHDLRNPLNAITLSTGVLLQRQDVDERTRRTASRIASAAERSSRLIRDLLDFTRARVGGLPIHPQSMDVHELVHRVVEEVRSANPGRRIEHEASGDGYGEYDGDRLAQVVTNLVGNALQHSPPGTPVRVTTRGEPSGIHLMVHNQGRPIPEPLLPKLFEPYRRGPEAAEARGSLGLGLYITRQIVLGHGGSIEVSSTQAAGTTFTVHLPRSVH